MCNTVFGNLPLTLAEDEAVQQILLLKAQSLVAIDMNFEAFPILCALSTNNQISIMTLCESLDLLGTCAMKLNVPFYLNKWKRLLTQNILNESRKEISIQIIKHVLKKIKITDANRKLIQSLDDTLINESGERFELLLPLIKASHLWQISNEEAIKYLYNLLSLHSNNSERKHRVHMEIANCLHASDRFSEAIKLYKEIETETLGDGLNNIATKAKLERALCHKTRYQKGPQKERDLNVAINLLVEICKVPQCLLLKKAFHELAKCHFQKGNIDEAWMNYKYYCEESKITYPSSIKRNKEILRKLLYKEKTKFNPSYLEDTNQIEQKVYKNTYQWIVIGKQ
jgi:tetratricopeptide (TPR) repeat protein